jgi:ubiquinone/menaquinone biosynthesis C-methylase UbiE
MDRGEREVHGEVEKMKRTTCSACGYDDLRTILDLGMSPVADAYTTTFDESSQTYPLQLATCAGCHLVQLLEVVSQEVLFGTGYSFYSSASAPLSAYHEQYARQVLNAHPNLVDDLVVEIGCNDGDMLQHFAQAACPTVGVDPSSGPVEFARKRGLKVINEPFTVNIADRITQRFGPAGVVIANHVLAHVDDVSEVLHGVRDLLSRDGIAYIEVQYLPDMLLNNAYDLVYHEHRNFFSLTSLTSAASRWGLHVYDAMLTDRQGGSLRVVLGRTPNNPSARARHIATSERWLTRDEAYGGLQGRADRMRERLHDLIENLGGPELIGYGAPAKATTLLNFCGLTYRHITCVIDTTLAKQGRFIPGTGVPIIPPGENDKLPDVNTILLLAWNYAAPIMRRHVDWKGHWIVPIPAPTLL